MSLNIIFTNFLIFTKRSLSLKIFMKKVKSGLWCKMFHRRIRSFYMCRTLMPTRLSTDVQRPQKSPVISLCSGRSSGNYGHIFLSSKNVIVFFLYFFVFFSIFNFLPFLFLSIFLFVFFIFSFMSVYHYYYLYFSFLFSSYGTSQTSGQYAILFGWHQVQISALRQHMLRRFVVFRSTTSFIQNPF